MAYMNDSTYTGHVVGIADSLRQQPVPDLPGEDAGALALVVWHLVDHARGRHAGLGAADGAGLDRPGLVISVQKKVVKCKML